MIAAVAFAVTWVLCHLVLFGVIALTLSCVQTWIQVLPVNAAHPAAHGGEPLMGAGVELLIVLLAALVALQSYRYNRKAADDADGEDDESLATA